MKVVHHVQLSALLHFFGECIKKEERVMKFKKGKKVLSLVLAALMVLSVMPTSMLIQKANAATAFEGGKEVFIIITIKN